MSLILNIDTATEIATVSISKENVVLGTIINANQKEHASFLHPAIKELIQKTNLSFQQLNAIAVIAGPGSYTGLRVGMASAKGLCYSLNIPLITINTLEAMALSAIKYYEKKSNGYLYCPMIDARRMEVFTALFNYHLEIKFAPSVAILNSDLFKDFLTGNKIIFFGSGASKSGLIIKNDNAIFSDIKTSAEAIAELAFRSFKLSNFANLFYAEPFYLKEFLTQ